MTVQTIVDSPASPSAGSLVDVRPVRDTAYLEGKDLEFKVIKIDQKRNNVVLSRRAVVESEFSAGRYQYIFKASNVSNDIERGR